MTDRLAGKRVLVTDADEFMGPDIVPLFREEGAEVLADTRDLTINGACNTLVAEAGRIDVLMVNLAGTASGALVQDVEDEELDRLYERIVKPLHRLTRAVLPQMRERRQGKIVVVGSATALKGQPRRSAYSAVRAAQHGYVRCVGAEVARDDINMNATGQTMVDNPTYFPPSYQATDEFKKRLEDLPAGRLSTGREAALFLLALAGPESDWLFGQIFAYAGGWTT